MKPILLEYTIETENTGSSNYFYDFNESLNVIIVGNTLEPFIEAVSTQMETLTQTKVAREANDFDMREVLTKTEAAKERDSEDVQPMEFELLTKTRINREGDNKEVQGLHPEIATKVPYRRMSENSSFNLALELKTKTFTQRERDD